MLAYRYDEQTKIYVGTINCQLNPIATKREGRNVFLTPANSVFIKPLETKQGFNIVWNGGAWEYVEIPKEEERQPYEPTEEEIKIQRIAQLKYELASYDYIGVKIAMGVATKEEYAEQIAYTETLRAKINALS